MNDTWIIVLVFGGVIALVGTIMYISYVQAKKRREAIEGLAESLGLGFEAKPLFESLGPLLHLPAFGMGRSKVVMNQLSGETEFAAIKIFDYRYTTGGGKNSHTWSQTMVSMSSPNMTAPEFDLQPEHFFFKIGEFFGMQDIDFDEHPEFSKTFILKSQTEDAVRSFFDEELINFFCTKKDIHFAVGESQLILFRPGKSETPEKWKDLMNEGFQAYQALSACVERRSNGNAVGS